MQNKNKLQLAKNNLVFASLIAFCGVAIIVIIAILALRPSGSETPDQTVSDNTSPSTSPSPSAIPANNSGQVRANGGPSEIIPYELGYYSVDSNYTIEMDKNTNTAKYAKNAGQDNSEELFLVFDNNPRADSLQRFSEHYFRPNAKNAYNVHERKYLMFNAISGTLVYDDLQQVVTLTIIEYGKRFYISSVRTNLAGRDKEQAIKDNEDRMEQVLDSLRIPQTPTLDQDAANQ